MVRDKKKGYMPADTSSTTKVLDNTFSSLTFL